MPLEIDSTAALLQALRVGRISVAKDDLQCAINTHSTTNYAGDKVAILEIAMNDNQQGSSSLRTDLRNGVLLFESLNMLFGGKIPVDNSRSAAVLPSYPMPILLRQAEARAQQDVALQAQQMAWTVTPDCLKLICDEHHCASVVPFEAELFAWFVYAYAYVENPKLLHQKGICLTQTQAILEASKYAVEYRLEILETTRIALEKLAAATTLVKPKR